MFRISILICFRFYSSPLPMLLRISLSLPRALSFPHALSLTLSPYSLTWRVYVAPSDRPPAHY